MELNLEVVTELRDNVYAMNTDQIPARAAWILNDFKQRMWGFRDRERSMIFSILYALAVRHCGEGVDPQVAFMEIPVPDDRTMLHEWFAQDVRNMDALNFAMLSGVGGHSKDGHELLRWVQSHVFCNMGTKLLQAIEAYQPPAPKKVTLREKELQVYGKAPIASNLRTDFYLWRKYTYQGKAVTEPMTGETGGSWMEVHEVGTHFQAEGDGAFYYVADLDGNAIRPSREEMADLEEYISKTNPGNLLLNTSEKLALEVMK